MNASITLSVPETRDFALSKLAAPSLIIGGALWVSHYALQVAMGLDSGKVSMTGSVGTFDGACFCGAIIGICFGLGTLGWSLRSRASALSIAGSSLALLASLSILVGFTRAVTTGQPPSLLGGIGVVGSCLSAVLVALALKRCKVVRARLASRLLLIGLLTFPLIIAFALPSGQWVPAFWTDELPFALSGAAYLIFGRALSGEIDSLSPSQIP